MERPDAEDEPSAKRVKADDNEEGEIEAPAPAPAPAPAAARPREHAPSPTTLKTDIEDLLRTMGPAMTGSGLLFPILASRVGGAIDYDP